MRIPASPARRASANPHVARPSRYPPGLAALLLAGVILAPPTGVRAEAARAKPTPAARTAGSAAREPAQATSDPALVDAPQAAESLPGDTILLDTVTVTARRRPEDPIDVPISMTVRAGEEADAAPSASNAALARSVPNFTFIDAGGLFGNAAKIRGVGAISPLSSDDTSVVFYQDEMPLSVYSIAPNLFDTQRVEVLRGPQGTLFGRNTQAGAVSIVSNRPSFERAFSLGGEIGSRGHRLGQFVGNGALVDDTLAGRLALRWNRFDGDIPNIAAGGEDGGLAIGAARASLLLAPDAATEALLAVNYGREDTHSPRFLLRDAPGFPVSATDPRTSVEGESTSVNLRLQHAFDAFVLNTQTAYQDGASTNRFDPTDALVFARMPWRGALPPSWALPGADRSRLDLGERSLLQEVRVSSLPEAALAWTAGVNLLRSDSTAGRVSSARTPAFRALNGVQDNRFEVESLAAFGEATLPLAEHLKATIGLRATHEDKQAAFRFDGRGLPGVARRYAQDASLDDDFLTGRAALSYEWTPDVMTYASVGRGYVTGGFPAYSVNSALARPEMPFAASTSWTYEAGFKSKLGEEGLSLSGATFLNDVSNGHLVLFDSSRALFTTVALDYRTYGGELELAAPLTPDLDLFAGLGVTHAELVDIPPASLTGARSGNRVPNVPALNAQIGADYRWDGERLGLPGRFTGRVSYQFVDSRAADVRNSFDLKAYGILDAKLTWQNGDVSVYAFGRNLLDERYEAWGQAFGPIQSVRVGQGRVVGLGTSFAF